MSMSERDKRVLKAFEKITKVVRDQTLPTPDLSGGANPLLAGPAKLTVAEVIEKRTITDAVTGDTYVNDSDLHPNDMDLDDLRAELQKRLDRAKELQERLDKLAENVEKRILANGPQDVTVDTKKNVNLRRALSRIYGAKTSVITFEMYKQALALRKRSRSEEITAASGGHKLGDKPSAS